MVIKPPPEPHIDQYEIDWPKPEGYRLLTPDEIYSKNDADFLALLKEDRRIEKKPIAYQCRALGDYFSMWANTPPDGGLVVLGMENDGEVLHGCETISESRNNELECTGDTFCPDARHESKKVKVQRKDGTADAILVFRVFYNKDKVVKTTAGKAFRRRGESKYEIPLKEVRELEHEKGEVDFEQETVDLKFPSDFNTQLVASFCENVHRGLGLTQVHPPEDILCRRRLGVMSAKGFQPNVACVLLFAKDPLLKFPGCKTRFLRFEGEHEQTGSTLNAVKDVTIEGCVPRLITETAKVVEAQLRTFSKLAGDGKFYTDPEYPSGAWYEAIVNACVHRSYSMKNQNIFVKMFDDRLVIESPGGFPPFVSPENIYEYSHPRNPHLMSAMHFLDYVKAMNEGTRRMRDSMNRMRLPSPEFKENEVGFNTYVRVVLRNNVKQRRAWVVADVSNVVGEDIARQLTEDERMIVNRIADNGLINVSEAQRLTQREWGSAKNLLQKMVSKGILSWHHRKDIERDSTAHYTLKKSVQKAAK